MTDWQCKACRAQVAPGAPRCPQCPSTSFTKPDPEAGMLKIARDGSVSDSAGVAAEAAEDGQAARTETRLEEHPGASQDTPGAGHPADGTMSPPANSDPPAPAPAPSRIPPRRTPPPGARGA